MNALNEYLAEKLEEHLAERRIVVWYDPKREFEAFVSGLGEAVSIGTGQPGLADVSLGNLSIRLVVGSGSLYGVKLAIEPDFAKERPDPLLIYLPGVERDSKHSPLMELEMAGKCWTPQANMNLRRVVREILRDFMSDGDIDEVVNRSSLTFSDAAALIAQRGTKEAISILKVIYPSSDTASLLAAWIAQPDRDAELEAKGGSAELLRLISARVGLGLPEETSIEDTREKLLRFVLVNEFREHLKDSKAPGSLAMIPAPTTEEHLSTVLKIAAQLREKHPSLYASLADRVETGLGLRIESVPAKALGTVDTFRFQEKALLKWCSELVQKCEYTETLQLIDRMSECFWTRHDMSRQVQWQCCRLMAELGLACVAACEQVRALKSSGKDAGAWVIAYTDAIAGWHRADDCQRRLEAFVSRMPADPESDAAIATARRHYEELLKDETAGFTDALVRSHWQVKGILHQTQIFADVVSPIQGPVAYFLIDAMRFEMARELANHLSEALEMTVRPAIGALPTITPIGMAALLPGASTGFSVVAHKGKIAAVVEGRQLGDWPERWKLLQGKVPGVVELPLGKVSELSAKRLSSVVNGAPLVVIRSQELDALGESGDTGLARQVMDTVLGNIARAVRKLSAAGIRRFVLVADHGHLFGEHRGPDMVTTAPGGETLEIKRRCWIGRGGVTPPSTIRVTSAELGYSGDLDFILPSGLSLLPAHDGLRYHHGGASLQEIVIPVVTFRVEAPVASKGKSRVVLSGLPAVITNRMFSVTIETQADLLAEPQNVRVLLFSGADQAGQTGMVLNADWDRETGNVTLLPGKTASIGLMLTKDDGDHVKIVVTDAKTDAVVEESGDIPLKLGV
jgi:hypothetical protein